MRKRFLLMTWGSVVALLITFASCSHSAEDEDNRWIDTGTVHRYYKIWQYFVPDNLLLTGRYENGALFKMAGEEVFDLDHSPTLYRQLALEHGETGDSLMVFVPLPIDGLPCWIEDMKVVSTDADGNVADVSADFQLFYFMISHEPKIEYGPVNEIRIDSLSDEHFLWMSPERLYVHTVDRQPLPDSLKYRFILSVSNRNDIGIDIN